MPAHSGQAMLFLVTATLLVASTGALLLPGREEAQITTELGGSGSMLEASTQIWLTVISGL